MHRPTLLSLVCAAAAMAPFAAAEDLAPMTKPAYTKRDELVRPDNFREWVFVGASYGLSYGEEASPDPVFHHVYMQPEAFRHYRDTGAFPEKTMLIMENFAGGSKEANTAKGAVEGEQEFEDLHGVFEDTRVGLEVAVKDSEQFPEGWAYFMFSLPGQPLRESAKAFPKSMCFDCHAAHAADDNVFVQFYPVLREILEPRTKAAPKPEASGEKNAE